jgi:hypothetical protein
MVDSVNRIGQDMENRAAKDITEQKMAVWGRTGHDVTCRENVVRYDWRGTD